VKLILRSLFVWLPVLLLMLALPFQGIASARTLPCAPTQPSHHAAMQSIAGKPHDHAAMLKAMASKNSHDGNHHGDSKAGSCADCCIGAALAPAALPVLALAPPPSVSIPFRAGHVPSVDPVLPERPPSATLA
jgi:hypothetical protein